MSILDDVTYDFVARMHQGGWVVARDCLITYRSARAVPVQCPCSARAVPVQCPCSAHAVPMQRPCSARAALLKSDALSL
jgi:hypothetical protein